MNQLTNTTFTGPNTKFSKSTPHSDSPLDGVDGLVVGVGLGELDPLGVVAAHEQAVGQGAQQVLQGRKDAQGDPKYQSLTLYIFHMVSHLV